MFDVPMDPDHHKNTERTGALGLHVEPCAVCGRAVNITKPHWRSYFHCGGYTAVTEEEYEQLNAEGRGAEQMGTWPVGPECKKKYPELEPYLFRMKREWL